MQWGAWAGAGLAAEAPGLLARLARQGHGALVPGMGLQVLGAVLRAGQSWLPAQVAASVLDWPLFLKGKPAPPFLWLALRMNVVNFLSATDIKMRDRQTPDAGVAGQRGQQPMFAEYAAAAQALPAIPQRSAQRKGQADMLEMLSGKTHTAQ